MNEYVELPDNLLKRLAKRKTRSEAIVEACTLAGYGTHYRPNVNKGIDWLDHHYPGWRGYENPKVVGRGMGYDV